MNTFSCRAHAHYLIALSQKWFILALKAINGLSMERNVAEVLSCAHMNSIPLLKKHCETYNGKLTTYGMWMEKENRRIIPGGKEISQEGLGRRWINSPMLIPFWPTKYVITKGWSYTFLSWMNTSKNIFPMISFSLTQNVSPREKKW